MVKALVSTCLWNDSKLSYWHQNANVKGVPNPICTCEFRLSSRPTYRAKSSLESGKEQVYRENCGLTRQERLGQSKIPKRSAWSSFRNNR